MADNSNPSDKAVEQPQDHVDEEAAMEDDDDEIPSHFVQAIAQILKWQERRQAHTDSVVQGAMKLVFNTDLKASAEDLQGKLQTYFAAHQAQLTTRNQ
jgi:hypothetical protein